MISHPATHGLTGGGTVHGIKVENRARDLRIPLTQRKMRSWGLSLLLLSAVTLDSCLSQALGRDIQDDTRIIEAVKRFNLEENIPYLYKPLDFFRPTLLKEEGNSRTLKFGIRETVCPRHAKRDLLKCEYQKRGLSTAPGGQSSIAIQHKRPSLSPHSK
ncbi:protegrin-2-like isoform X2 [Pseudophryne corroboree]|uniref:protegrin-2-like isoform X2 n=1 Tax=Pseudophryne corroboree TaxID=495146 RepID=UPI0030815CCA